MEEELKGNWRESFRLKNGVCVEHTPAFISLGGAIKRRFEITSRSFQEMPLPPEGLVLEVNANREEFVEALYRAEVYEGK